MFCDLVDEYDEIAEAFPVDQSTFTIGGPPRPASDRWSRIVRAMVLRKFILQTNDQAHISKVVAAVRACALDPIANEFADEVEKRAEGICTTVIYGTPGDGARRADEIVEDVVYGGFMHGDYGRWSRTRDRSSIMVEQPLWDFTLDSERLVRPVRDGIRVLIEEGKLGRPPVG